LSLWDIGTRSPIQAVRDVAAGFSHPRRLLGGIVRTLAGLGYAALAIAFVVLALGDAGGLFSVFAIGTFLAGLIFEALVGPSIRRLVGIRPTPALPTDGSPPAR
jgi:hypothetical protein